MYVCSLTINDLNFHSCLDPDWVVWNLNNLTANTGEYWRLPVRRAGRAIVMPITSGGTGTGPEHP